MMRWALFAFVFSVAAAFSCVNVIAAEDPPAPAVTAAQPINVPDLSGDWCGSWSSCVNGHKGPMRASFCRQCDGSYRVTFVGRFAALIPFRYTTTLTPTSYSDGVVYLAGSSETGADFRYVQLQCVGERSSIRLQLLLKQRPGSVHSYEVTTNLSL